MLTVAGTAFIRKVYALLFIQLLITAAFTCLFVFSDTVKNYVSGNVAMFWTAWGLMFGFLLVLVCFENARRRVPWNYILLFSYTICMSYLVGVVSSYYNTSDVLIAVGITTFLVLSITLFAFQTKWDFTGCGPYLFVLLIGLLVFGFLNIFFYSRVRGGGAPDRGRR